MRSCRRALRASDEENWIASLRWKTAKRAHSSFNFLDLCSRRRRVEENFLWQIKANTLLYFTRNPFERFQRNLRHFKLCELSHMSQCKNLGERILRLSPEHLVWWENVRLFKASCHSAHNEIKEVIKRRFLRAFYVCLSSSGSVLIRRYKLHGHKFTAHNNRPLRHNQRFLILRRDLRSLLFSTHNSLLMWRSSPPLVFCFTRMNVNLIKI